MFYAHMAVCTSVASTNLTEILLQTNPYDYHMTIDACLMLRAAPTCYTKSIRVGFASHASIWSTKSSAHNVTQPAHQSKSGQNRQSQSKPRTWSCSVCHVLLVCNCPNHPAEIHQHFSPFAYPQIGFQRHQREVLAIARSQSVRSSLFLLSCVSLSTWGSRPASHSRSLRPSRPIALRPLLLR